MARRTRRSDEEIRQTIVGVVREHRRIDPESLMRTPRLRRLPVIAVSLCFLQLLASGEVLLTRDHKCYVPGKQRRAVVTKKARSQRGELSLIEEGRRRLRRTPAHKRLKALYPDEPSPIDKLWREVHRMPRSERLAILYPPRSRT